MKKILIIIIINLIVLYGHSQILKVINKNDLQGIENVFVFNKNNTLITNSKGEADLTAFNKSENISFQHTSYETLTISFEELQKINFVVKLSESVLKLNEVVISQNRWEQDKREVPNKITSISAKEIGFSNSQTTADVLSSSGEVFVQKSQLGGGSPMIRGFSTNRILIVVDGVRMNNAIYRSGNLQNVISLDANSIENMEVIFGPGSVIYGSDALGGVMDFHTLQTRLSESDKPEFKANTMTRYSSANNEKTGHFDFNIGLKKWSFLTSVSYSDFDDLRMGSQGNEDYVRPEYVDQMNGHDTVIQNSNENIQRYSNYNQLNIMQKIRFKPNENWNINYGFHYSKVSDVPRYDRLLEYSDDRLKYAEWYYGPQIWMMNDLSIEYFKSNPFFDKAKLVLAYQDYEESRHDRKFGKEKIRERTENVKALSANLDFDKQLSKRASLFYGLEAVYNRVNSTGQERDIFTNETSPYASRYPDGSNYSYYAAYVNYKNNINELFTFVAGLRYSRVMMDADFDATFYQFPFDNISINTGALNGSLGLVYRPTDTWQFNFNASSGFPAPNIDDVGKVFDSEPGSVIVPNEQLDSEYAYSFDMSVLKTINHKVSLEASAFYTLLQDAMLRRDFTFNGQDSIYYDGELSKVQAIVNDGEAYVYGFNLGVYADLMKYLSFKSVITYTKGEDGDGVPLRHVAPLFGSTHFIFKAHKFKADVYAIYNGEISYENLSPEEHGKTYMYATDSNGNPYSPSWYTLNLKMSYQVNSYLQVNLGMENIMDQRYRPYSSGIVAPGRNIIVALRARI